MPCTGRQGTSPAKKNLKPKMASILATLFWIIVITYKKDGEQKAKPKIASKKLPRISPAMENYFRAIPADGRSSRHSQPTFIAHNILAAAHGFKSAPSLRNRRNTKTSDSTRYTLCPSGISETYISKPVCGSVAWRKFRPFLLVCMREQKLNIMSQHK